MHVQTLVTNTPMATEARNLKEVHLNVRKLVLIAAEACNCNKAICPHTKGRSRRPTNGLDVIVGSIIMNGNNEHFVLVYSIQLRVERHLHN